MNVKVLNFDADGTWLQKYFSVKRPMVLQAMERLGSDTIILKNIALPRMLLVFGFTIEQLEDEELSAFDRQVDTNDACVVLDWMFHDFDPMKPSYDPEKCEFSNHMGAIQVAGEGMEDEFSDPIEGAADEFSEPVETDRFNPDD